MFKICTLKKFHEVFCLDWCVQVRTVHDWNLVIPRCIKVFFLHAWFEFLCIQEYSVHMQDCKGVSSHTVCMVYYCATEYIWVLEMLDGHYFRNSLGQSCLRIFWSQAMLFIFTFRTFCNFFNSGFGTTIFHWAACVFYLTQSRSRHMVVIWWGCFGLVHGFGHTCKWVSNISSKPVDRLKFIWISLPIFCSYLFH